MAFRNNATQRWYEFEIFQGEPGLSHGVFTRRGGVSPAPWSSLNMATSVGDERERVLENRRRISAALDLDEDGFYDVWQVHGTRVIATDHARLLGVPHEKADAIITHEVGVALLMLFADCVPLVAYDPGQKAIGMAHAGWQGTVERIGARLVESMHSAYGSRPADLLLGIGPSICMEHYQVGPEVVARVEAVLGGGTDVLSGRVDGRAQLDLWEANRQILLGAGVQTDHIQVAGLCTAEAPRDWYSHRGEAGKTGRFGAVIALR